MIVADRYADRRHQGLDDTRDEKQCPPIARPDQAVQEHPDCQQPGARTATGLLGKLEKGAIFLITALLVLAFGLLAAKALAQQSIAVYTVSQLPVRIPPDQQSIAQVIVLDRILQIESALTTGVETLDPEIAMQAVRSRLSAQDRRELTLAWQALGRIERGELVHLPAIVFDGQSVWYGTNFSRGLAAYRNRKQ